MKKVYVYDPTASDLQSAVRGIGRYLQILKENFKDDFNFINFTNFKNFINLKDSVFINPFFNFLQKPVTLKRIAHKQIAVIHDLIPFKYPSHFPVGIKGTIYTLLNKLSLKNYDLIITDSEASKLDIVNMLQIDERKVRVIYPCLPKIFLETGKWKIGLEAGQENGNRKFENPSSKIQLPNSFPNPTSNFCLYVGDATWNKNLVNLARAIKLADVNCVFVGKAFDRVMGGESERVPESAQRFFQPVAGREHSRERNFRQDLLLDHPWQKELKEFYELTKNDKRFIFAGFVPDSQLLKLYQQAEVNILPSRDEGFGFSYLEASAIGCPSLLSDIPVLKEISNNNALFFNPESPEDIAEKIKKIYSDYDLRQKLITDTKKRSLFFSIRTFKVSIMRQM